MTYSTWVAKWLPQFAHTFAGAFFSLLFGALFGVQYGQAAAAAIGGVKEFAVDPFTGGNWKGDAIDFAFWNVGGALGMIASAIVRHKLVGHV